MKKITDVVIKELSLIYGDFKGQQWEPINPEARLLHVKGGAVDPKPSFLNRVTEALKGYFATGEGNGFPVSTDVPDDIDDDGDGAEDYNAICSAICSVSYDLQNAMGIGDDRARSIAIKVAIDGFIADFDSFRSEKAGARHSKADQAHIAAIAAAHKAMGEHLAALKPDAEDAADGGADDASEADDKAAVTPDAGDYADPGYQEDKKKRYPLDTEEHVRAAASYFGMAKNRDKYTAQQQKTIQAKIDAAEKKFGVGAKAAATDDQHETNGEKAGEIDMTEDQLTALLTKAVADTAAAVKAELAPQIDEAKAEAAKAAQRAEAAEASLKAAAVEAAKPTAAGAGQTDQITNKSSERLQRIIKAQLAQNTASPRI